MNIRKPRKRILAGAAGLSLLLGMSAASAATVIIDDSGSVTRIENLEVSSGGAVVGVYNVDFLWTSAEAIYGSSPGDFDFESFAGALDARDAVNAALNDYNATRNPVEDPEAVYTAPRLTNFFLIGFEYTPDEAPNTRVLNVFGRYNGVSDDPPEQWVAGGGGISQGITTEIAYADFTVVPVPAAVWLFGSALGLLGWVRKRTRV